MPGQNLGQSAFPRAIWAHQGVHFASGNAQTEAAHDFLVGDGDAQVFYFQFLHKLEPEIYASWDEFANGRADSLRLSRNSRIWIYRGGFLPALRETNIIAN